MTLREKPVVRQAQVDDRVVDVRVVVPDDSYVDRSEIGTVVVELVSEGEPIAAVATVLSPENVDQARALAEQICSGLEEGSLEPTAEGIEDIASTRPA